MKRENDRKDNRVNVVFFLVPKWIMAEHRFVHGIKHNLFFYGTIARDSPGHRLYQRRLCTDCPGWPEKLPEWRDIRSTTALWM